MRKFLLLLLVISCFGVAAYAANPVLKIARTSSTSVRLNARIENAPLSAVVQALSVHLTTPVVVETGADRLVSYQASGILPDQLLTAIVKAEDLVLESRGSYLAIRDPLEPTVSLDVKDAEVGVILGSLKEQCGIRNVMIDPDITERKGTFLFTDVPCTLAFKIVFNSLGLTADFEPNSVLRLVNRL